MNKTRVASLRSIGYAAVLPALLVALTAGAFSAATAPPQAGSGVGQLRADIAAAAAAPGVRRGVWGVVVHSLDRNERLFELNPGALLAPASTAKLVSVATAADAVGWDYRFATEVRASGPIVDRVLRGDLIVIGSGDPSIGGRGGSELGEWASRLRQMGIDRIEGRIIGDDSAIEKPRPALAWTWEDLGYSTGAIFGALNVAENRMTVTVAPGPREGAPGAIRSQPNPTHRLFANLTLTGARGSAALVWPEQRPGEPYLTIAGSVPMGAQPVTLSVSAGQPTLWFATELRSLLVAAGIAVTGGAHDADELEPRPDPAAAQLLFVHRSRPLSEIAQPLLKESINIYGEAFMRLNAAPGVFPTNDAALEGLAQRLTAWGIPPDSQRLIDGSGLSRRNAIAPEALLAILQRMDDPRGASPFVAGMPVAGVDGTLAARMRGTPAEGNLRAKTGTMANVRSMAGYVRTRDGERLAFVIILNNFEGLPAAATEAVDGIAVKLASFRR